MIKRKPVYHWYCTVHRQIEVFFISLHNADIRMCATRPHMTPCVDVKKLPKLRQTDAGKSVKK